MVDIKPVLVHSNVSVLDGNFFYHDLIPARNLEDHVPSAVEEERHSFLSFIRAMITWLPEERKTARELIEHPFLKLGST